MADSKGCRGCFEKVLGLFIIIVGLIGFGIWKSSQSDKSGDASPATVLQSSPNAVTGSAAMPSNKPAAQIGIGPDEKPPQTSTDAQKQLDASISICMARLKSTPAYQVAANDAAAAKTKLDAMRATGAMDGRLDASSDFVKKDAIVKKMEQDSIARDTGINIARSALETSRAREAGIAKDQEAKQAEAERQQSAEIASSVNFVGQESAKKIIGPMLKNPDAAVWDIKTVEHSTLEKSKKYQVWGIVRSTNSFNAVVPEQWEVEIRYNNDTFFPVSAKLGEKMVWVLH